MTKRLYFEDSYQTEATAQVESVRSDGYEVILDQTIFYPTSGGQPHDTGTINGIEVKDVWEEKEIIIHRLAHPFQGKTAHCVLNWERRFDHMQQHTGQHLLSAAFMELLQAPTVSFHLGAEYSTIDVELAKLNRDTCDQVEDFVNEQIFQNLDVLTYFVTPEQAQKLPLRKKPRVNEHIRIVEIVGHSLRPKSLDYSPCGGTHLRRTGELGLLKITHFEVYKDLFRVYFLCGKRALSHYRRLLTITQTLKKRLSSPENQIVEKLEILLGQEAETTKHLKQLTEELLEYQMLALYENTPLEKAVRICTRLFDDPEVNIRDAAFKITKNKPDAICLFAQAREGKCNFIFAASEEVKVSMNDVMKETMEKLGGKGGGSAQLAQGGIGGKVDLERIIQEAQALVRKKLDESST